VGIAVVCYEGCIDFVGVYVVLVTSVVVEEVEAVPKPKGYAVDLVPGEVLGYLVVRLPLDRGLRGRCGGCQHPVRLSTALFLVHIVAPVCKP